MAYSELLADRIRNYLDQKKVSFIAKKMMGGLCFMVDDKMCVGVHTDHLMARIGPEAYESAAGTARHLSLRIPRNKMTTNWNATK